MIRAFKKLPKWLRILLLAFPGVNWIVEILLRITPLIDKKYPADKGEIIMFIISIIFGLFLGWVDLVKSEILDNGLVWIR